MKSYLAHLIVIFSIFSCNKEKVTPEAAVCFPQYGELKVQRKVVDVPVVFRMSGGLIGGGWLVDEQGATYGALCNLPQQYKMKDSVLLSVSGYFVTSASIKESDHELLPFVVTSAKLR